MERSAVQPVSLQALYDLTNSPRILQPYINPTCKIPPHEIPSHPNL